MPRKAARPCAYPGCIELVRRGKYCPRHARAAAWAKVASGAVNKDKKHDATRPSAAERGYDYAWQQTRASFLAHHPFCIVCGQKATHVDHIVARRRGGSDDESNLQALCASCHSRKTATIDGGGWPGKRG